MEQFIDQVKSFFRGVADSLEKHSMMLNEVTHQISMLRNELNDAQKMLKESIERSNRFILIITALIVTNLLTVGAFSYLYFQYLSQ